MVTKKLTLISLFAGCGGSSLGYKMSTGFDEKVAVEWWEPAAKSLETNFKEVKVLRSDIMKISGKELLNYAKIELLDVLDGSPPCQGFSMAGKRKLLDPRNDLVNHYIRLIHEIKPRAFVMENVKGMIIGKMKGLFNEYLLKMRAEGYTVYARLLNAMHYGVPQSRQRIIIIGFREKNCAEKFQWPTPFETIIPLKDILPNIENKSLREKSSFGYVINRNKPIPTIKKSCNSAKKDILLNDNYGKLYDYIKPGQNASYLLSGKGRDNCKKPSLNKPCNAICKMQSTHGFATQVHPFEKRPMTINECKLVCSFPIDYYLNGNYTTQWGQLGNSVPPKMMQAIAEQVKKALI